MTNLRPQHLVAIAVVSLSAEAVFATPLSHIRVVALTGNQAPGAGSGQVFGFFSDTRLAMNDLGQTAIFAILEGSGVTDANDFGIWSEGGGSLGLLVREAMDAPGPEIGRFFESLFSTRFKISENGDTAFLADLAGSGVTDDNNSAIWVGKPGALSMAAREGEPAPNLINGVRFDGFSPPSIDAAGRLMFVSRLRGPEVSFSNRNALWFGAPGALESVVRLDDPLPGTPSSVFTSINTPTLADSGAIAFLSSIKLSNGRFHESIWSQRNGILDLVARQTERAPGIPNGASFSFLSPPEIDDLGNTAFRAAIARTGGIDSSNDQGIWSEAGGDLELVLREGWPVEGETAGVFYSAMGPPVVNRDRTVFIGALAGPGIVESNDTAILSHRDGSLSVLAREGTQAVGVPDGQLFGRFRDPHVNSAGQVIFSSQLVGNGVDSTNDFAIWGEDRFGNLTLVVRDGDLIEVAPGDFRTISGFRSFDLAETFNGRGQLALVADFDDGSRAVIVSSLLAIPEPSTAALCVLATFGILFGRRRLA